MPSGTLIQKIDCHPNASVTTPPINGPVPTPVPTMPPQTPNAIPIFCGGKAARISVRVTGVTIAVPMPCTARAAIRASAFGASAAAIDAMVNSPTPAMKTFCRPNRSPNAPPVNKPTATARA